MLAAKVFALVTLLAGVLAVPVKKVRSINRRVFSESVLTDYEDIVTRSPTIGCIVNGHHVAVCPRSVPEQPQVAKPGNCGIGNSYDC
jgi:hypothetical protein